MGEVTTMVWTWRSMFFRCTGSMQRERQFCSFGEGHLIILGVGGCDIEFAKGASSHRPRLSA
jgi:hypothetical protein